MSNDREYVDAAGVEYVAAPHDGCEGCAFHEDFKGYTEACLSSPPCNSGNREGESIIWVRKEGGEQ